MRTLAVTEDRTSPITTSRRRSALEEAWMVGAVLMSFLTVLEDGWVGSWRGGSGWLVGPGACVPPVSRSGVPPRWPWSACSVSSSRPSNRACGSPAHGSPTFFTGGVRLDPPGPIGPGCDDDAIEGDQAELVGRSVELSEAPGPAALMSLAHQQGHPHQRLASDLGEGGGGVPVPEIARPAAQEQVDVPHDFFDRSGQPSPHRHEPDAVSGVLSRPARRPPAQGGGAGG